MTQPTVIILPAANVNLLTTEMNSQANAAGVTSSVGGTSGVFSSGTLAALLTYMYMNLTLHLPTMTAMTANNLIQGWFLERTDASNYENAPPSRPPDFTFVCTATTTADLVVKQVPMPVAQFKVYLVNNSGQAFASSGCILTALPWTPSIPTQ